MIHKLDDIHQLTPSMHKHISKVDVHFGLSGVSWSDDNCWEESWKLCLSKLFDIHPHIVCVHHNANYNISQEIIDLVNQKSYLLESSNGEWYIWSR